MNAGRSFDIVRWGSTRVTAHSSLLVAAVVLVVLFAPRFDQGPLDPYVAGLVFVVALYLSIFLHELAHVVAARAWGLAVPRVVLHLLGGHTEIVGTRGPAQAGVTALVGPLASAGIAGVAFAVVGAVDDATTSQILWSLAWVNLLLAVFNLLPGLPLDGGHVVAALGWAVTGRRSIGTTATAWVGRGTALGVVVLVVGFRLGEPGSLPEVVLGALVAVFLWTGASRADALATAQRADEQHERTPDDRSTP